jgi:Fe2+ transport system protein B
MDTLPASNINDFIESLIQSYESRIKNIENFFFKSETITQSSFDLLKEFNRFIEDYKTERDQLNFQLMEKLAKTASLRKKDYERMMSDIMDRLEKKEQKVKAYFSSFIEEQRSMILFLKGGIFENSPNDNHRNLSLFYEELKRISAEMESKKDGAIRQLNDYQQMNRKIIDKLKELLNQNDLILVKDVKKVHEELLKEIA